jgi:uncharacterized protein
MEIIVILLLIGIGYYFYKKRANKVAPIKTSSDFKMGTDYAFGLGFPSMDALAAQVFTASAKNGDVDSYAALGNMYARGIHFKKDYEEAYKWLKLAADFDHPTAMFELAKFYIEGYGIPKDEQKSMTLLIRASELGEPSAQFLLGLIYQEGGFGLEKNERESLNWFMKSAKLGNTEAQLKVGDAYLEGNLLSKDVGKAFEYWTKSAEKNNITAMKRLRSFYIDGIDNIDLASTWTLKAAELDDSESQRQLGSDFLLGTCGIVDYEKAFIWSKKAADKGDAQAQYALGIMYKRGFIETGIDLVEAKHWFELAASQGIQGALDQFKLLEQL